MSVLHDISAPDGLKPRAKYFPEVGDTCINVDGAIEICKQTDTPEAKRIWKAFRKRHVRMRSEPTDLAPEKLREEAFFAALRDCGFNATFTPVSGTMG